METPCGLPFQNDPRPAHRSHLKIFRSDARTRMQPHYAVNFSKTGQLNSVKLSRMTINTIQIITVNDICS